MKLYHNWKFAVNRLMDIADGYFLHPVLGYRRVAYRRLPGHLAEVIRDLLVQEPPNDPDHWVY